MIQLEELRLKLKAMDNDINELYDALNIENLKIKFDEYQKISAEPEFWNDIERSQTLTKEAKQLENVIKDFEALKEKYEDNKTMVDIAIEEDDESLFDEVDAEYNELVAIIEKTRLATLLTGEHDASNAILTLHAGAGGTESQDWVEMLYRMYSKYASRNDFKVKVLDYLAGDDAGIKSISFSVEGHNCYGFLKSEAGVHRLVRISPFDSSGRRHTSFASVDVMPEIQDDEDVEINSDDLKVDTYRAGGAGGQHVNKTESAIRITHIPTGLVVACQNERSQHQNREVAMKMLKSKLVQIKERERLEKIEDIKGIQKEIGWGSQIRSYVFMPYTLAKDHRTSAENGNINAVMDGDIELFINEYLKYMAKKEN